jgi:hypothetical protein
VDPRPPAPRTAIAGGTFSDRRGCGRFRHLRNRVEFAELGWGNIFIKIDPVRGSGNLAMGTQQVPVGAGIPIHRQFEMDEAFYVLEGAGTFALDDVPARSRSNRRPPAATPLQRCASARAAIPAWTSMTGISRGRHAHAWPGATGRCQH